MIFTICGVLVQELKKLEAEGSASPSKQREGQREIKTICSIICVYDIFVLLPETMQYLYESV